MLKIDFDERSGIVRYENQGFHSPEDVRKHAAEARNVVAEARRKTGTLRVLVLRPDGLVQSPASMAVAKETKVNQPGDRIAIVLTSSLLKMQAERYLDEHERIFTNEADALAWLNEP